MLIKVKTFGQIIKKLLNPFKAFSPLEIMACNFYEVGEGLCKTFYLTNSWKYVYGE